MLCVFNSQTEKYGQRASEVLLQWKNTNRNAELNRNAETDKDLCVALAQVLLRQGHPQQVVHGHVHASSEDLQGAGCKASEQPVPVLCCPPSTEVFPWCSEGDSCSSLCLFLCLGTGPHQKGPGSVLLVCISKGRYT